MTITKKIATINAKIDSAKLAMEPLKEQFNALFHYGSGYHKKVTVRKALQAKMDEIESLTNDIREIEYTKNFWSRHLFDELRYQVKGSERCNRIARILNKKSNKV